MRNVDVAALHQLGHLAVEEGQQQRADVSAIDVGIGHDDDAVVAQLGSVEVIGATATPADAALVMQLGAQAVFVGSGIFKSSDPSRMARAIVEAATNFDDADVLARVSRGLGDAMPGLEIASLETKLADRGW